MIKAVSYKYEKIKIKKCRHPGIVQNQKLMKGLLSEYIGREYQVTEGRNPGHQPLWQRWHQWEPPFY